MANVKQGNQTRPPQWWKHLRDWKRVFWKSERQAQKESIKRIYHELFFEEWKYVYSCF
jgi:hypothetical protein